MLRKILFIALGSCLISQISFAAAIHHEINATLDPSAHTVKVENTLTIPADRVQKEIHFLLHGDLEMGEIGGNAAKLSVVEGEPQAADFGVPENHFSLPDNLPLTHYVLELPTEASRDLIVTLNYQGTIYHEIIDASEEYARSFSETPGIISEKGVYLGGSSWWLPWFNENLVTFNLTVTAPRGWRTVSQGNRTLQIDEGFMHTDNWESPTPVDEPFLIAGQFTEYNRQAGNVEAMVFLQQPDDALAEKYLEVTAQYIQMYSELIGPYLYKKFALVENFWETGYGMPSFTLLGPKVIRFPFILHSSYPHEILHNWWGNGVFVDYDRGNWCEGLTVYQADHLIKEQRGQAVEYRRATLQKFTDYVKDHRDFPLVEFRSRHDASSEAVGYGKSMMMYHMLRRQIGDESFTQVFQKFYRDNKFTIATFADIQQTVEEVTGDSWAAFFEQWTTRTGAPELILSDVQVHNKKSGNYLVFTLSQVQESEPFVIKIPVAVYGQEKNEIEYHTVEMSTATQTFELTPNCEPVRIEIDPEFDIMRQLHWNEVPPALSKIFSADDVMILLPAQEDAERRNKYQELAELWDIPHYVDETIDLTEHGGFPIRRTIWLFGWDNAYRDVIAAGLADYDAAILPDGVRFGKTIIARENHAFVITVRNPQNPELVVVWLAADNPAGIPGLSRKLPHYGKYSYLAFEGDEPANVAKGQWPAVGSPLSVVTTEGTPDSLNVWAYPERNALAELPPVFSANRMMKDIEFLADEKLKGRGWGTPELDQAAQYIFDEFKKAGLDGQIQEWTTIGGPDNKPTSLKNIIGVLPGANPHFAGESVVISAHYDHLGLGWPDVRAGHEGQIHPGADDNASGVAVLLELARTMRSAEPLRTILFVAFTGEEARRIGSKYYVENFKDYPIEKVMGNLNLDTVGRLHDQKLLLLNGDTASEWKHLAMGIGFVTGIESELVTQELDASDQVSFIEQGIPALQIFTGPHEDYHRPTDTIDRIDADGLVKVATFVREAAMYLAEREEPLTFTGSVDKGEEPSPPSPAGRKVSTGCMPDFAYSGEGMKIGAVAEDSPADKAGLQAGDIIVQVGETPVKNLKEYSDALKHYRPGDVVKLVYRREAIEAITSLTLENR